VEVIGGKRIPCPTCQAAGTIRVPLTEPMGDSQAANPGAAGA